jgi:hypothetical protein
VNQQGGGLVGIRLIAGFPPLLGVGSCFVLCVDIHVALRAAHQLAQRQTARIAGVITELRLVAVVADFDTAVASFEVSVAHLFGFRTLAAVMGFCWQHCASCSFNCA